MLPAYGLKNGIPNHRSLGRGPLTYTELCQAVEADFAETGTLFEGQLLWHMEGVKLNLETWRILWRVGKAPRKYYVKESSY